MTQSRPPAKPEADESKRPDTDQTGGLPPGSSLDQKQRDNTRQTDQSQPRPDATPRK